MNPDEPHSPHELARALAEDVRRLNHATDPHAGQLEYPGDVYSVLGMLTHTIGSLPQSLDALAAWMTQAITSGAAIGTPGDDHAQTARDFADDLAVAAQFLHATRDRVAGAHERIADVRPTGHHTSEAGTPGTSQV